MADLLSQATRDPSWSLIGPDYSLYKYTDQIYKIVHFKIPRLRIKHEKKSRGEWTSYDKKLDASLSRARRVVLELALCNDWTYFCTFTLLAEKYDREDLKAWYSKFSQWLRDQRKKYGLSFPFVLVPELHNDGKSWHMHGLFGDIGSLLVSFAEERQNGMKVPDYLVNNGFFDWPDYRKKFGFCSFGLIRNKVAASFYVTKYVTKSMQADALGVGMHLYYCSHNLNRAVKHGEVYGNCDFLNQFLNNDYEFVSTGLTQPRDGCDWAFGMEYMYIELMESFGSDLTPEEKSEFETFWADYQYMMEDFLS